MPTIIECNVMTGEVTQREMTQEEIDEAQVPVEIETETP